MARFKVELVVALAGLFCAGHPLVAQPGKSADETSQVRVRYAAAADLVAALSPILKGKDLGVELVPEPVSNTILVRSPVEKRAHVLRLIAELDALSKVKQYVIEVRVCQGDPLGRKEEIDVLSRPILMVLQGQPGTVKVGQTLPGLDSATEDFVGVSLHFCATGEKGGTIRLEMGAKIAELVTQAKDRHEIRSWSARQQRDVRYGETIKMRLKGSSASEQTWLEATVKEVTDGK